MEIVQYDGSRNVLCVGATDTSIRQVKNAKSQSIMCRNENYGMVTFERNSQI